MTDAVGMHSESLRSSRAPSHVIGDGVAVAAPPGNEQNANFDLDAIFSAVSLPEVEFKKAPSTTQDDHHLAALAHMDEQLALEESESYRSSASSLVSPTSNAASSVAQQLVENIFQGHESLHEDNEESASQHSGHLAQQMKDLHLATSNSSLHSYASGTSNRTFVEGMVSAAAEQEAYAEEHADEPAHLPVSRHISEESLFRKRSQTVDSMASVAESRYGAFYVHDDEGEPADQEVNLHHDEVAYRRPKQPKSAMLFSPSAQKGVMSSIEEEERELANTLSQLEDAKQHIAELTNEIDGRKPAVPAPRSSIPSSRRTSASTLKNGQNGHNGANNGEPEHIQFQNEHNEIYEEDVGVSQIARKQLTRGFPMGEVGGKTQILPEMFEIPFGKRPGVRKVVVGGDQPASQDDKTVLLFGPIGSGKTSLLNSILNYLYDVKRENGFRFVLSEHTEPSTSLTAFVINNSVLPFSVTIVDTPGIPNVKGDKTVSTLIQAWFEQELVAAGQFRMDAISIVLRHDEKRLDWPFINELAIVKRMFGDDLKTNVLPIITHSEVLPQPVAIRALAQANISFLEYYKVNNSGFFPAPLPDMTKLKHNLYFNHGIASLENFFKDLQELIHPLMAVLRSGRRSSTNSSVTNNSALY